MVMVVVMVVVGDSTQSSAAQADNLHSWWLGDQIMTNVKKTKQNVK